MSKDHSFINSTALESHINTRFPALEVADKEELISIITAAKMDQLQKIEVSMKGLMESSGIEPLVLNDLIGVITDISPESRAFSSWETEEDSSLKQQLLAIGGEEYAEEYYYVCRNVRHQYLLNKETLGGNGKVTLADTLIIKGHSQITGYIKANTSPLVERLYPEDGMIVLRGEPNEISQEKRASRAAANQDFTLTSDEIESCVRNFLQMETALVRPMAEEGKSAGHFSDPMLGDLTSEQYEARVTKMQALQNQGLLTSAIKRGERHETKRLLQEMQVDPTKARENGLSALIMATEAGDSKITKALIKACATSEQKHELVSMADHDGNTPLQLAERKGDKYTVVTLLAGYPPEVISAYPLERKRELLRIADIGTLAHEGNAKVINALLTDFPVEEKEALLLDRASNTHNPFHQSAGNPLHLAAMSGHPTAVRALFKHASAELRYHLLQDTDGNEKLTPIHVAAQERNPEMINALFAGCSSVEQKRHLLQMEDADDRTPLDTAVYFEHKRVAKVLRAIEAEIQEPAQGQKRSLEDAEEDRSSKRSALPPSEPDLNIMGSSASSEGTISMRSPTAKGPH